MRTELEAYDNLIAITTELAHCSTFVRNTVEALAVEQSKKANFEPEITINRFGETATITFSTIRFSDNLRYIMAVLTATSHPTKFVMMFDISANMASVEIAAMNAARRLLTTVDIGHC